MSDAATGFVDSTASSRPVTPIDSRAGFQQCVRGAFAEAAARGCRELWLSDPDFADWPLGERAVVEQLTQWTQQQPQRRFHLVASNFDVIARLHPRWVEWRRQWAHQVDCRGSNSEVEAARIPTLLLALAPGEFSLRLFDKPRMRGRFCRDMAEAMRDREALDAILQQSHPAFAATVTGL